MGAFGGGKGRPCPFKVIICQEGYCRQCQIYRDWLGSGVSRAGMENRSRRRAMIKTVIRFGNDMVRCWCTASRLDGAG